MTDKTLVWVDLETFGLDAARDPILEMGFVLTDLELNMLDFFSVRIWEITHENRYARLLGKVESTAKFILDMHTRSGLFVRGDTKEQRFSSLEASVRAKKWLTMHGVDKTTPMCGSSVHFDRAFLKEQMPEIEEMFSYRNIDISTLKELCSRLNPEMFKHMEEDVPSRKIHRVEPDLEDTIAEAKWYFDNFLFRPGIRD